MNISPEQITSGSSKKIWWLCAKNQKHRWQTSISHRIRGQHCPFCSGRKVDESNCLAVTHPDLAEEWHQNKNGKITPYNITKGITRKYWWKCHANESHEWKDTPNHRTNGRGCPLCSKEIYKVKSNSLFFTNPELSKEWNYEKNIGLKPEFFKAGSGRKVWWKCLVDKNHEWDSLISNRARKNHPASCPFCSNQKVSKTNSLTITNPKLANEWNVSKNANLKPSDFTKGSGKKVWWQCPKGKDHQWIASISDRNNGNGCPACNGFLVVKSNNLRTMFPKIAKEWHITKNKTLKPEGIYFQTQRKIWWKCSKGIDHEWITTVFHRTKNKSGCPFCTLTPQSRQELSITFELKSIFNKIDPKGFKTKIKGKIWSIDIFIPELNLGIEFDGSHWHKHKVDLDKLKTIQLKDDGFHIIRVREEPLNKISEIDIISSIKFDAKKITNDLLERILNNFELDKIYKLKINNYLKKKELQNEQALEKYIDKILKLKSKR